MKLDDRRHHLARLIRSVGVMCTYTEALDMVRQFEGAVRNQAADEILAAAFDEDGRRPEWNWWDAATIPEACAKHIRLQDTT
ncbi:hypothetical protein ACH4ZU_26260 [Streptomyces sp. NPDC020472]|uniref:hypothetical protein n=1 Tax=Streptomyces sp. NPDC020472 TaxID=3365075 RepID=UPI0037BBF1D4